MAVQIGSCLWTSRSSPKRTPLALIERQEGHFWDHKSAKSPGATIQAIAVALANADGGEFILGIEDVNGPAAGLNRWQGFTSIEAANHVHQALVKQVHPPVPYTLTYLQVDGRAPQGIAVMVQVMKSASVHMTDAKIVYVRRGAQNLLLQGQQVTDLTLSKGTASYEDQTLAKYDLRDLAAEPELVEFLRTYSPRTDPEMFAAKQRLIDRDTAKTTVAAAVLYAEVPSAVVPKKCAVKVARYRTSEAEARREHLEGTPLTIEGPARQVIDDTISEVTKLVESVSILHPDGSLEPARYPPEALKEIVVNAVIHRDYNISDDILVLVFDNRVEVRSPGILPGHMTLDNLLSERFSRNPTVVRLLNKYPDPPNKDIGEGLDTVVTKMHEAKLKEPQFFVRDNSFVVVLGHTSLASPEDIVMEYLETNEEITNAIARKLCAIPSENEMKRVFLRLAKAQLIERVPGKRGGKAAWQKAAPQRHLDI